MTGEYGKRITDREMMAGGHRKKKKKYYGTGEYGKRITDKEMMSSGRRKKKKKGYTAESGRRITDRASALTMGQYISDMFSKKRK